MALRWVWAAAVANVAAWALLLSAIERSAHGGNRYAGYGVFVALYALALPAISIVCAIVASLIERARRVLSIVGIVAAIAMAGFAAMTAIEVARRRAEAKAQEAQYAALAEQRMAKLLTMSTTELVRALDDPSLRYDAGDRLLASASFWSAPCVGDDRQRRDAMGSALAAARSLGKEWRWSLEPLHAIASRSCPAFAAPLVEAVLDGAVQSEPSERGELAVALRRRDPTWLRRAHAKQPFSDEDLARAEREAAAR